MIDSILKLFGVESASPPARSETDAMRAIGEALDRLDPDRARFVAAYAYILGRVAYADHQVTPEETRMMEQRVMERGGLPEDQAALVVQIAKTQNRLFRGTEDYLVTREFQRLAGPDARRSLIECLYAVSAADRSISTAEDNEIQRIATQLKVEHADVVAIRTEFREHLAVMRPADRD